MAVKLKERGAKWWVYGLAAALRAHAVDLPPHAHNAGGGWYTCDRGYIMRARQCISEADAAREARILVPDLPSAGSGAPAGSGEGLGLGSVAGASPAAPGARGPFFIQTNKPWTVILDAQGNPSTVIVGGAPARAEHSALFGGWRSWRD
jgi:hypothetical protein